MTFFSKQNSFWLNLALVLTFLILISFGLISSNLENAKAAEEVPNVPNFGMVPKAGSALARQIDRQLAGGVGKSEGGGAPGFSLIVTIPADINDLEKTNPLARQMAEEMARWFVQAGYNVNEVRMSSNLYIDEEKGELMMSRKSGMLKQNNANVMGVLVGTYTTTKNNIRFNVRMVQASGNEVLGMATITLPIDSELKALLSNDGSSGGIMPSVGTRLPLVDASRP